MWSWSFWRDALERAITAAAAAAASVLGTDGMGLLDVAWPGVLNAAALAGLASFLLSIVGGTGFVGARGTASVLPTRGRHARD